MTNIPQTSPKLLGICCRHGNANNKSSEAHFLSCRSLRYISDRQPSPAIYLFISSFSNKMHQTNSSQTKQYFWQKSNYAYVNSRAEDTGALITGPWPGHPIPSDQCNIQGTERQVGTQAVRNGFNLFTMTLIIELYFHT